MSNNPTETIRLPYDIFKIVTTGNIIHIYLRQMAYAKWRSKTSIAYRFTHVK